MQKTFPQKPSTQTEIFRQDAVCPLRQELSDCNKGHLLKLPKKGIQSITDNNSVILHYGTPNSQK